MAADACSAVSLQGADSVVQCPNFDKGTGSPFFESITSAIKGNPAQLNYGVAITDFDGDGEFEAFVAGFGVKNQIYKWNAKEQSMVDIVNGDAVVADATRKAIGVAACDVDGDGHEEVYVLNTDAYGGQTATSDRLLQRDAATGTWRDMFTMPKHASSANFVAGRSCACVDRNGDGKYGVFVANYGGAMRLYEIGAETGALFDAGLESGVGALGATGGRAVVAGPITGGPRMDVLANNEWSRYSGDLKGSNFLLTNLGDGKFANEAAARSIEDQEENGRGTALFDANHDGRVDVVYGNWNGPHRLMIQQPDGTFRDVASGDMAEPTRIRTVITADFDNDGKMEIFWNNIPGENKLFQEASSDGKSWTKLNIGAALEADGYGTGAAVADFDGDGILELLVSHGESAQQPLSMFKATSAAAGNHYLRVFPKTRQGSPARGATVALVADGMLHARFIDSGSGYLCQMEPVAHFGLGATVPGNLTVTVTWPDGASYSGMLAADKMHTIEYPGNAPSTLVAKDPLSAVPKESSAHSSHVGVVFFMLAVL